MARMLQRLGNEVVSADHGEAGLKLITASHEPGGTPFDVVFLDK
jgi:CheY-like chemotaxis protein